MFELFALGALLIFTFVFAFKFLFFLLGLIFGGVGLLLKLILTIVGGVLIFPVAVIVLGALFSGGGLILLLIFAGLAALVGEKKRPSC